MNYQKEDETITQLFSSATRLLLINKIDPAKFLKIEKRPAKFLKIEK